MISNWMCATWRNKTPRRPRPTDGFYGLLGTQFLIQATGKIHRRSQGKFAQFWTGVHWVPGHDHDTAERSGRSLWPGDPKPHHRLDQLVLHVQGPLYEPLGDGLLLMCPNGLLNILSTGLWNEADCKLQSVQICSEELRLILFQKLWQLLLSNSHFPFQAAMFSGFLVAVCAIFQETTCRTWPRFSDENWPLLSIKISLQSIQWQSYIYIYIPSGYVKIAIENGHL